MKETTYQLSRRKFIRSGVGAAVATAIGGHSLFGAPAILPRSIPGRPNSIGVQLGVITYSYRSMPDQSAGAILQYVLDSGINAIELMGDHAETFAGKPENPVDRRTYFRLRRKQRDGADLSAEELKQLTEMESLATAYRKEVARWRAGAPEEKFKELRQMYKDAGVTIYAFKPSAFGTDNREQEIHWGMKTAKLLGANHVTLEHPGDDTHTQKLGDIGRKYGMYVAYHGHEQQRPTFWDTALEQSPFNALNPDLGHYVAAGNKAPLDLIKQHHSRIMSLHLKDRQNPANGKANLPWGQGDTPIVQALRLIQKHKYGFPVSIELEYEIPEGSNAVQEVKKCMGFCQEALS